MTHTLRRAAAMLLAVIALTVAPNLTAHADYGSGAWGGPTGTPTQDAAWGTPGVVVGIAGDSITNRCAPELRAALLTEAGVVLAVRAWSGQNTANTRAWALSLTYKPQILIMATGTNDIFDPPVMAGEIAAVKAGLPATTTLVWTDVHAARAAYPAATQLADQRNSGWVSNQIHAALPANQVVDWAAASAALAGTGRPGIAYYYQDGVHPWAAAGTGHGDGCAFWAEVQMWTLRPLLGITAKRARR